MRDVPDYASRGLVNLVCELEQRLIGSAPGPGLDPDLAGGIPEAPSYVLILFDGLGTAQLTHPGAAAFRETAAASLDAPFPATTSVSLATVATGLPPSRHGLVSHLVWLEELGRVVNTLKWVDLTGAHVSHDYAAVLPRPNLWERLRAAGMEPITVQPGPYLGTPLSRLLYRGARFEAVWGEEEMVEATVQLASEPGRLILAYMWEIDFAGHVHGLGSEELTTAMRTAARIWERLQAGLPPTAALVGTSDHGLIEYSEDDKILVRHPRFDGVRFAGDPRGIQLWDAEAARDLAELTGGALIEPASLLGPDPTAAAQARLGEALVLAPDGKVILPRGFDKRLRCYHGGIHPAEREVPLLIG